MGIVQGFALFSGIRTQLSLTRSRPDGINGFVRARTGPILQGARADRRKCDRASLSAAYGDFDVLARHTELDIAD